MIKFITKIFFSFSLLEPPERPTQVINKIKSDACSQFIKKCTSTQEVVSRGFENSERRKLLSQSEGWENQLSWADEAPVKVTHCMTWLVKLLPLRLRARGYKDLIVFLENCT